MDEWKNNVYFVLVEPKEPGNIGASARAMKNMGFTNLCLVNPPPHMPKEERWFACNAHDVLKSAKFYDSVKEAVSDKSVVVGTTQRKGMHRGLILPVSEGAEKISAITANNKVAILFGTETNGLSKEDVDECGFMITIPSSKMQPSLNLSQAVLIIAYELSKYSEENIVTSNGANYKDYNKPSLLEELEAHGEIAPLYDRIAGILELLEYAPRGNMDLNAKIITSLKRFIGRAGLTELELNLLMGLCTQIEKKLDR
ncbi:MAG: RNA methyltransferase [Nitrospirae bacterium]|nr:RNA methyltransferase [Nitrospirota bacterium]